MNSKLLSRRFLLALGAIVSQFIPGLDPALAQDVAQVVMVFIAGESAVDFQRERTRPEIEKVRRAIEESEGE